MVREWELWSFMFISRHLDAPALQTFVNVPTVWHRLQAQELLFFEMKM